MDEKACFKCGRTLPLGEFYRAPGMSDGRQGKCKDCAKQDVRARYRATREERLAYEKRRNRTTKRRRALAAAGKRHAERHPDRYRARNIFKAAIRDGKIVRQPCEVCGNPRSEGHHEDYSRPLEVRWLCRPHHRAHEARDVTA